MNSLPLHPAIVHLPMGLAMIMPVLAAGFAWALVTGRVRSRAWLAVVALQALLLGTGLVAINTGGQEEERVERIVAETPLEQHEEYAEQFVWAAGATLALAVLVLAVRRPAATLAVTGAVVVLTVAVAGLGIRVGHAGGQLVYVHGAAAAYTANGQTPSAKSPALSVEHDRD
jgi:uncharacterized membrane protein